MKKFLIRSLLALLVILVVCLTILFFTPKPLFTVVNALPLEAKLTQPEDYSMIEKNVYLEKDISYSTDFPKSSLDIYSPKNVQGEVPVILFVHGGGFFKGEKEMAKYFGPTMTNQQYAFVSVDYDLVPHATIFDQVKQLNEALAFIKENAEQYSLDTTQINLAGSSAGGFLALQLLSAYHDEGYAAKLSIQPVNSIQFSSLLLYSAVYDLSEFQSYDGGILADYLLGKLGWGLTGKKDWRTNQELAQLLNLSHYVSSDFPPIFITDGNTKTFTKQATSYAKEVKKQGITVETLFFDSKKTVGHGYQLNMKTTASQQAVQQSLAFLASTNK